MSHFCISPNQIYSWRDMIPIINHYLFNLFNRTNNHPYLSDFSLFPSKPLYSISALYLCVSPLRNWKREAINSGGGPSFNTRAHTRYACGWLNDCPWKPRNTNPSFGVLATWLLATHAWISPAYARVNIVGSTLLSHTPCSSQSDTRNCSNRLTLLFSFPFSKADSSSAVYTTEREYTTSHISTQTSPASPTTSTRDIVTVSVQYNVSTTDLETSHARWVCQFPASRGDVENDGVTRNRTCTLCVFPVTRRIR